MGFAWVILDATLSNAGSSFPLHGGYCWWENHTDLFKGSSELGLTGIEWEEEMFQTGHWKKSRNS